MSRHFPRPPFFFFFFLMTTLSSCNYSSFQFAAMASRCSWCSKLFVGSVYKTLQSNHYLGIQASRTNVFHYFYLFLASKSGPKAPWRPVAREYLWCSGLFPNGRFLPFLFCTCVPSELQTTVLCFLVTSNKRAHTHTHTGTHTRTHTCTHTHTHTHTHTGRHVRTHVHTHTHTHTQCTSICTCTHTQLP